VVAVLYLGGRVEGMAIQGVQHLMKPCGIRGEDGRRNLEGHTKELVFHSKPPRRTRLSSAGRRHYSWKRKKTGT